MLRIWEPLAQIRQCTFHHSDQIGWDVAVDVMLSQEPPKQLNRLLGHRLHFLYGTSTCKVLDRAVSERTAGIWLLDPGIVDLKHTTELPRIQPQTLYAYSRGH